MLFLLTGEVQIGKTRWLQALVDDLAACGVPSAGVLAPGQWVASTGAQADANGYEKRGIDNVLLPEGTRIPFARRRDIAQAEGSYDEESQAARAQLAWHIDDEAIAKVNAYFDQLGPAAAPGLLVVDELGRLEVWRGEGLTSAVRRLQEGPSPAFPHALVVVRDYLADETEALLAPAWTDVQRIAPDEAGRRAVFAAFGRACA